MVPSTATPWACNPKAATRAVDPIRPISPPGMRRSMCALTNITASTPSPMATVHPLTWPRWVKTNPMRWVFEPPVEGSPRKSGSWWITMMTATPDRKPVTMGVDRNSAIHPRRRRLTSITMSPTITARIATSST